MIVGIPREVKDNEFRVAATPEGVTEFVHAGHTVLVQSGAGLGSGISDDAFARAGARITDDAPEVFEAAGMILKVKEPVAEELGLLREGQILFTYLHLAAGLDLTESLMRTRVDAIGYETVQDGSGRLPLLAPMSEIAGRMAPQVGASLLEKERGGRGVLMGGAVGVAPARVLVLGAGMAGSNAAWLAAGMEAEVLIVDNNVDRLRFIDQVHRGRIQTLMSGRLALERLVPTADLLIGTVLIPGARAPKLVSEEMVTSMRSGSVIVDISVDQGGCVATSKMTTHSDPTFVLHDVVHYCVGNMPGAVPSTSTYALTNVTLPYALAIADKGLKEAGRSDRTLARGVNVFRGEVTNEGVAQAHGFEAVSFDSLIGHAGARDVPGG